MRPLLLTPGDPLGIGPEVSCRALVSRPELPVVVIGDAAALHRAARAVGGPVLERVTTVRAVPGRVAVVDPGDGDEPVEVAAIRLAVDAIRAGEGSALVTGPIHKEALAKRGFPHPGHTEFLGALCGVERPVMAFVGGRVAVALVTVHLPLRAVADAVTHEGVAHTIRVAHAALVAQLGLSAPRVVVCGLNPHAGDGGVLGGEEQAVIGPAVAQVQAEGIPAEGPISAEAAFRRAVDGRADLVVAMYHDQGLAPLKALDFGRTVNWTLGLPIVRTSVDHGTARDIAGQWVADPRSMEAALDLAARLAR